MTTIESRFLDSFQETFLFRSISVPNTEFEVNLHNSFSLLFVRLVPQFLRYAAVFFGLTSVLQSYRRICDLFSYSLRPITFSKSTCPHSSLDDHSSMAELSSIVSDPRTYTIRGNERQLRPSNRVRHFLKRCLDHPNLALDFDQAESSPCVNAFEKRVWYVFKSRFAKVAWYPTYLLFCESRGSASQRSLDFERVVQTMPYSPTLRFIKETLDLVQAGSRYNFVCMEKRTDEACRANEG